MDRINLSLDTLSEDRYRRITRGGELQEALKGLRAALQEDFERIKINAVLLSDTDSEEIRDLAGLTKQIPVDIRFIELMPMPAAKRRAKGDISPRRGSSTRSPQWCLSKRTK